jgi:coatomer protein complex subunit gamma
LEDVDINLDDHVFGLSRPNFAAAWEELPIEKEETFALSMNASSIPEAVKNIIAFLGMYPCDRTDRVPEGKSSHTLALAGKIKDKDILDLTLQVTVFLTRALILNRSVPWWH